MPASPASRCSRLLTKTSPLQPSTAQTAKEAVPKKKDEIAPELTPLEKMLQNAGPLREDGTDKFFGFENALFYSDLFRESVINYPSLSPSETPNGNRPKVGVTLRPPMSPAPPAQLQGGKKSLSAKEAMKQRQALNSGQPAPGQPAVKPEDKPDTPEYKKKQAMLKGPILELAQENAMAYGMDECTFTGLKDIFLAVLQSGTRTGVLSPQRFLEIFKRDNEMFRNSMHQDAHEFYGLVLNDVIANVEANARRIQERLEINGQSDLAQSVEKALGSALMSNATGYRTPGTGWVHDIFEGVLTSETKCLTCETASQRDETFLDLSIDLEEHSSVTSCLRKFSAEEMLCERNKFHCDHCGGLQEAEKRMKVKRLPKVLTLHLKRFKYTEDYSRLQKLFHRVVYPYHLRMFNTTEDAEDPDRMYELYAVVVHIGGNAYHGHYVSIIKTKDRGWVLFDDEMVEPVDKHFVRNFFGDKPGMATAYVLFYQETTFEKVREEQEREGMEEVKLATQAANVAQGDGGEKPEVPPLKRQATQPAVMPEHESLASLAHAVTAPLPQAPASPLIEAPAASSATPFAGLPGVGLTGTNTTKIETKSRDDLKREKKEREAAEKAAERAAKQAEKDKEKLREKQLRDGDKKRREDHVKALQARRNEQDELQKALEASKKSAAQEEATRKKEEGGSFGFLDRSKRGSKSMSKRSFGFFKDKNGPLDGSMNGDAPEKDKKGRISMGLGRKKSTNFLS
ncbi:ubiquitin hydrolase [Trichoderma cornu-damae]|uniref:ubiquitinyl hydrolase 1 n=1 Tax=Trichoderma cornu-damae TaxID=654480 RepID=A0A9P8QGU7_9HYPO|nr:ubiquitin hydrolase [Trichoderma cornu-damae]